MNMRDKKKTFAKNLGDGQPLVLEDNCQVLLDPLRVEVLGSTCLQLESVLLEVLKADSKEHCVCCVDRLNAVLGQYCCHLEPGNNWNLP